MPQANSYLSSKWTEKTAFDQLADNFKVSRGGIIYPVIGYTPTELDLEAVDYLFQEWDYGYIPTGWDYFE